MPVDLFGEATVSTQKTRGGKTRLVRSAPVPVPWWYEKAPDPVAVDTEMDKLKDEGGTILAINAEDGWNVLRGAAVERVVRRTVSDKLKEWYRGVAAWSPEDRQRAIESAQRMKDAGYLQ